MLTTARLAARLGISTTALYDRLSELGMVETRPEEPHRHYLTETGKEAGGVWRPAEGGGYLLWPASLDTGLKVQQ